MGAAGRKESRLGFGGWGDAQSPPKGSVLWALPPFSPQSANSFHSINTPAGQASQRPLLPEPERPNQEGQEGRLKGRGCGWE